MLKDTYFNTVFPHAKENKELSGILGALCFWQNKATSPAPDLAAHPTHAHVQMARLDNKQVLCELFQADGMIKQGQLGAVRYRCSDSLIFGVLTLSESDFEQEAGIPPLQAASRTAYEQIFAVLEAEAFPSVLRFWNYMARINEQSHGLERYRQFNLGRQQAFDARQSAISVNIPAACALGSAEGPLIVAFMASRVDSLVIENPRQISAYDYPLQYGPRSPLFSRAGLATIDGAEVLFLSGTASIVGHETLHAGDVLGQTRETIANINAVLVEANRKAGNARFELASLHYKVYVRNAEDYAVISRELAAAVGPGLKAVYLQADICRQDLLVEIEGTSAFAHETL